MTFLQQVLKDELQAVHNTCRKLQDSYKPKITYVVVQKRHHTRFFCAKGTRPVGRGENIAPGTTVDTVVTHPTDFDYYQCSHFGIQGTSKPIKYTIIYDDSNQDGGGLFYLDSEILAKAVHVFFFSWFDGGRSAGAHSRLVLLVPALHSRSQSPGARLLRGLVLHSRQLPSAPPIVSSASCYISAPSSLVFDCPFCV